MLKDKRFPAFTAGALLIGFGHSFLAMSGYESLAQVYREIESPKPLNLRRTGLVVFFYSLVFTASVSFLAAALIPDSVRPQFYDNLISGIAMNLAAAAAAARVPGVRRPGRLPDPRERGQHGDCRIECCAEPRVGARRPARLVPPSPQAERHDSPVPRSRRGLQLLNVLLSGGHIYILGEVYAFGVIWSFALKSLSVLVLRFKDPGPREWRVPLNLKIRSVEPSIGLAASTLALLSVAIVNLFTKEVATIAGASFTLLVYVAFVLSERATARRKAADHALDQFQLLPAPDVGLAEVAARPAASWCPSATRTRSRA